MYYGLLLMQGASTAVLLTNFNFVFPNSSQVQILLLNSKLNTLLIIQRGKND